jgi:hypothetical protein
MLPARNISQVAARLSEPESHAEQLFGHLEKPPFQQELKL